MVEFDGPRFLSMLLRMGSAYLLALPIGWERESSARTMGMRTFPLVGLASAAFILIALEVFAPASEAQARVLQGLITGIGFIGAGAILKGEARVYGTATAASVWATAAIGAACAYGYFEIGAALSAMTFVTLRWMTPIKERVEAQAGLDSSGEGGPDGEPSAAGERERRCG